MKLFLSYRRADTQAVATYMAERLEAHPGIDEVFLDVHDVKGGRDWADQIQETLRQSDGTLVLIGEEWKGERDDGTVRLNDENDPVASEVEFALASGKPVYVALVDGTLMPKPEELPAALAPLSALHAWPIRSDRLRVDVNAIAEELAPIPRRTVRAPARLLGAVLGAAAAGVALLIAAIVHGVTVGRPLETTLGGFGQVWLLIAAVVLAGMFLGQARAGRHGPGAR